MQRYGLFEYVVSPKGTFFKTFFSPFLQTSVNQQYRFLPQNGYFRLSSQKCPFLAFISEKNITFAAP